MSLKTETPTKAAQNPWHDVILPITGIEALIKLIERDGTAEVGDHTYRALVATRNSLATTTMRKELKEMGVA